MILLECLDIIIAIDSSAKIASSQIYTPTPPPLIRRTNGQEGFVPANYVRDIEPAKVKKATKKKEMVSVPVKVVKKKIEKRKVARASRTGSKSVLGRRSNTRECYIHHTHMLYTDRFLNEEFCLALKGLCKF